MVFTLAKQLANISPGHAIAFVELSRRITILADWVWTIGGTILFLNLFLGYEYFNKASCPTSRCVVHLRISKANLQAAQEDNR
jgi:hypothetical protein